jgi:MarR family transcriptional regulator for hemolysin
LDPQGEFPLAPAEYFFYLLYLAARQRDLRFGEALSETGLSLARWRTLAIIRRIENCTMKALALYTAIDRTTLTRAVDVLVEQGLVDRLPIRGDRRKVSLALTEAGEAAYARAVTILMTENGAVLQRFDDGALRDATRILQQVIVALMDDVSEAQDLIAFGRPSDLG